MEHSNDAERFLREVERRAGEPLARMLNYVKMGKKFCMCSGCVWLRRILGESK